jgi:chloramphenicol 3-O phosphotransferase
MSAAGDIILLNGTSSSGKTTIARAFQQLMPQPYYRFGLDMLQPGFPPMLRLVGNSPPPGEGWEIQFEDDRLVKVQPRAGALRLISGMYRAIAAFASAGNRLIVEDAIYQPDILEAAVGELHDKNVLFVGVMLPLAVAEQREQERGDRAPGGASTFYAGVHAHGLYDVTVDSGSLSPEACARQIRQAVEEGRPRTALQELWRRRQPS